MPLKIESDDKVTPNPASLEIVNRKLESFIEVVMAKLMSIQKENSSLKKRVAALEKKS